MTVNAGWAEGGRVQFMSASPVRLSICRPGCGIGAGIAGDAWGGRMPTRRTPGVGRPRALDPTPGDSVDDGHALPPELSDWMSDQPQANKLMETPEGQTAIDRLRNHFRLEAGDHSDATTQQRR